MKNAEVTSSADDNAEIWYVQLASGAVRAMSLDELDGAFQEGSIDETTYVRRDGVRAWAPLGQVLAGDDAAAAPVVYVAPVTMPSPAPVSMPAPSYGGPHSTAPMVAEVSSPDLDDLMFRPKRRGRFLALAAVVMVLGGAAFTVKRVGGLAEIAALASSAAGAPKATEVATPPAAPPTPPAPAAAAPSTEVRNDMRLTDDQRRALLDLDKVRAAKQKPAAAPKKPSRRAPHSSGKPVFHKGGDSHDPLNSAL